MTAATSSFALRDAVVAAVCRALGESAGRRWLATALASLGGQPPNALLDDPIGARMVLAELHCAQTARTGPARQGGTL